MSSGQASKSTSAKARAVKTPSTEPAPIEAAYDAILDDNGDQNDDAGANAPEDSGSLSSSSASLTESIYEYRRLHGRTYQASKTTEYWAPNDAQQNEGLDVIHAFTTMIFDGRLFLAPIDTKPARVVDVGTGTGIWAIDFADQFPDSEVLGTDISPIQPSWVPPNLKFVIEDCNLDWTWARDHFDFVHIRGMYGSVPDWVGLYRSVFAHLKPGGWLESVEGDVKVDSDHVPVGKDHIYSRWAEVFREGGEKMGRSFTICQGHQMREYMEQVGFVDVVEKKFKVPLHGWPKDPHLKQIGLLAHHALDQSLDGFAMFMATQTLGWDKDKAVALIDEMRREIRRKSNCPWYMITVVYGRKPLKG